MTQLTGGSIRSIVNNEQPEHPVLQILDCKRLDNGDHQRYRLVLSDGINYHQSMLASSVNNQVEGQDMTNAIIRLNEYICNSVHDKQIIIVLNFDVVSRATAQIGQPQAVPQAPAAQPTMAPSAAQALPAGNTGMNGAPAVSSNNNAAPAPRPAQQQLVRPTGGAAVDTTNITAVRSLNPYQNRWTIKARVTSKTNIRTWNNERGSGKLFSVDLVDKDGTEIRATMFQDAVDKFYALMEVGKVYYISRGQIKDANKKFTSIKHDYELSLNADSFVQECADDNNTIPRMQYDFVPIADIANVAANTAIDVIGIVIQCGELSSVTSKKTGEPIPKRLVTLLDATSRSIELTLWGNEAEHFSVTDYPVLAVKGTRVSEYNNRSLSGCASIDLSPPDVEMASQLRQWFDQSGGIAAINIFPLSSSEGGGGGGGGSQGSNKERTFEEVKNEMLGHSQMDYYSCTATVLRIKSDSTIMYDACPKEGCMKKVFENHTGQYRCEKCNESYPEPNPRYLLRFTASDHTGGQWFAMFNDEALAMLKVPAKEVKLMQTNGQTEQFNRVFENAYGNKYHFRVRAKSEEYQGQSSVKHSVVSIKPVNFVEDSRALVEEIRQYM